LQSQGSQPAGGISHKPSRTLTAAG